LLVGSIIELNKYLKDHQDIIKNLQDENIDLVSGGPPCQSFSMAGLRQHDNNRNTLPMDFAEFVGLVKPKIALLENVSGILRAFSLPDGKHYAWFEVAKAFVSKGYYPICLHVNAKYAGAAQNRPRFIMIALREDVFQKFKKNTKDNAISKRLSTIESFYNLESDGKITVPNEDLHYYDIDKECELFETETFKPLYEYKDTDSWFSVKDAIDDLRVEGGKTTSRRYPDHLNKVFKDLSNLGVKHTESSNHAYRENSPKVRMRFKLYQYLAELTSPGQQKTVYRDILSYLRNPQEHKLKIDSIEFLLNKKYLDNDGESLIKFEKESSLLEYIQSLATKKQTQRALIADKPAPAALSIPDDACHYSPTLQRTLTVREMARFQSFPDWFEFRSKVTTGGKMRRFEVPQYTQVGNAVPPLLGQALGLTIRRILDTASTN